MIQKAFVFCGRFQGLTRAHEAIYKSIEKNNPDNKIIILIIDSKESREDKQNNPFSRCTRKKMWQCVRTNSLIVVSNNPYKFIGDFKDSQYQISQLYVGSDRYESFKGINKYYPNIKVVKYNQDRKQNEQYIDNILRNAQIGMKQIGTRQMSRQMLREALKLGFKKSFNMIAPQSIGNMYSQLKDQIGYNQGQKRNEDIVKQNKDIGMGGHLQHIQDIIINKGKKGLRQFVERVQSAIKVKQKDTKISQKIDGRPSIFFGDDPLNGKFFVATKSFLSKNPKLYHSVQQIRTRYRQRPQLMQKLISAFLSLNNLIDYGQKIYNADVLFTTKLQSQYIDDQQYLVFTPNVITYAVLIDQRSLLYKDISEASFGAVVHGKYAAIINGDQMIAKKQPSYDFTQLVAASKTQSKVFLCDPFHQIADVSVLPEVSSMIEDLIKKMTLCIQSIDNQFDYWWVNGKQLPLLKKYLNKQVRGQSGGIFAASKAKVKFDFNKMQAGFKQFLKVQKSRQISKIMLKAWDSNRDNIKSLLAAYYIALNIKDAVLSSYDDVKSKLGNTFVKKDDRFEVTKPQGFVLMSGDNVVKLVDRLQFSKNNFLYGRFNNIFQSHGMFQKLLLQKLKKKMSLYMHFTNKAQSILGQSKRLIQTGSAKGIKLLQGLRCGLGKTNSYIKVLQSYNTDKRKDLWKKVNQSYNIKKRNLLQMIDLASALTNSVKNTPIGINQLLTKNWVPINERVKPIFDKLNYFNQKFMQHIQGIFMSDNFTLNWQKAKDILRKARMQVSKDKQQTTPQNILNQLYDKITRQGQLDSPSQRMKKIKQATTAYAQQLHVLGAKVSRLRNQPSTSNPQQKKLTQEQFVQAKSAIQMVRKNLQKIAQRYEQLMVLTSTANKGKFYVNLMLLFWGNRKLQDIQNIIHEIQDYNPTVQGFGFQKFRKANTI